VIGNDNGLGLGQIASDRRRDLNLRGTHVSARSLDWNLLGLGLCVIGNLEEGPMPEE
jgi:hypothetical protein